ncbi:ABC transporter substrate-binding protein (plasmid) [Halarchaeum sp. CBA1220]|uniref:ABC transporter substrate-binding protein n=1 Tax=Halarchaeum sp. CBA1220 TaxID=1853682 RepID=UPI000F3A9159|nr:ABC transporter substrate-binding protein [Halarchaeum sp. CBA1220]QLC35315.1 ABC transporter substrate-binding protein [Halarchaeum sp. CBA1220]
MARRRQVLAGSAGLIATALAGCSSSGGDETNAVTTSSADSTTSTTESGPTPYTVDIEPNDPYTFEDVPETYGVVSGPLLDVGMSLGIHPSATTGLERAPLKFYDLLGLEFDESRITKLASGAESGYDKENFYAANADVWLIPKSTLARFTSWDESDYAEIESQTGPFLGTPLRFAPTAAVSSSPNPYTLYEAFEKYATVFQRQQQFRAWQSMHDDLMRTIEDGLPPEDDRPTVAAIWRGVSPDSGRFRIAPLHRLANNTKSYYRLGMTDAFEGQYPDGPIGYEELLDVDPDYIGAVGALTSSTHEEFVSNVIEPFENNENGQDLSAVQNGNVIRSAGQYMGPIVDMFSTEAVAKQVYPDTFGEWPGPVGELSEDEQLFDRQRLLDIVNRDV